MEIRKSIQMSEWNEEMKQKVKSFWQERGVVFAETQGDMLEGKRGSLWGNFTSFDMSKLMATLTVFSTSPTEIVCILNVNTILQHITEWNTAYLQLELDTLESWLLHGDKRDAEWQEFLKGVRKAAILWVLTAGTLGRKISPRL